MENITIKNIALNENKNYDCCKNEYKIYQITNMKTGLNYISYTKLKYLSRVKEDILRKKTDTFTKLLTDVIYKEDVMIELINVIESENLYYVKQYINSIDKNEKNILKKCIYKPILTDKCIECDDNVEKDIKVVKEKKDIKEKKDVKEKVVKIYKYDDVRCEFCEKLFTYKNIARHKKSCSKKIN